MSPFEEIFSAGTNMNNEDINYGQTNARSR